MRIALVGICLTVSVFTYFPRHYAVTDFDPVVEPLKQHKSSTKYSLSVNEGRRLAKAYAKARLSASQYFCLKNLWNRESGWNYRSLNSYSGAYGIPQALPGSKMSSAGSDWKTNPITQVKWGLRYINGRYGSPCEAWRFFQRNNWY